MRQAVSIPHRGGMAAWHERLGPASDEASGFGFAYTAGSPPWPKSQSPLESPLLSSRVFDGSLPAGSRRGTPGTSPARPVTLPQGEGAGAGASSASALGYAGVGAGGSTPSNAGRNLNAGALELWREPQAVPVTRVVEVFPREVHSVPPPRGASPAGFASRGEILPRETGMPIPRGSTPPVRGASPVSSARDRVSPETSEPVAMQTAGLQRLGRLEDGLVTIRTELAELCGRRAAGRRERLEAELRDLRPACEELAKAKQLAQMAADRGSKLANGCEELQHARSSAFAVEPGAECGAGVAIGCVPSRTWADNTQLVARDRARQERLDRLEDQLQKLLPLEVQLPRAREELAAAEASGRRTREELELAEQMAARSEASRSGTKLELDHVRGELVRVDGELRWHRDELERVRAELRNARAECQALQCQSAGTSEDALKIDRLESELRRLRPMERQLLETTEELEKAVEESRRSQAELARTREQLSEFSAAEVEWAHVRDELARAREELARRNFERVRENDECGVPAETLVAAPASGSASPVTTGYETSQPVDELSRAREELARAEAERTRVREDRAAAAAAFLAEVELQDAAATVLEKASMPAAVEQPWSTSGPPPLPPQSSAAWRVLAGSSSAAGAGGPADYDGYDALSGSEESITPSQSASRSNSPQPPVRAAAPSAPSSLRAVGQPRDASVEPAAASLPSADAAFSKEATAAMHEEELADFLPWAAEGHRSEECAVIPTAAAAAADAPGTSFPAASSQATWTASSAPSANRDARLVSAAADWPSPAQTGSSLEGWATAPAAPASASTAASSGWAKAWKTEKVTEELADFCPWGRQDSSHGSEGASFVPWDDTSRSAWPEQAGGVASQGSSAAAPSDKQAASRSSKPSLDGIISQRPVPIDQTGSQQSSKKSSPSLAPEPPPQEDSMISPTSNLTVFGSPRNAFSPTNPFSSLQSNPFASPGNAGFVANPRPGFSANNPFAN